MLRTYQNRRSDESGAVLEQSAEVVAVGAHEDVKVNVGDVVVLRRYSGTEVELDGEEHRIVDAEEILGVVEG